MMPPAGTSIGASSDTNTPEANDWTTDYQPLFSSTTIDHSLAEVAKTFHWREFGNGAANGGTGATYADASMLDDMDDIAYVMDDGLTSYSGDDVNWNTSHSSIINAGGGTWQYITFIGTGITLTGDEYYTTHQIAQNLPYGTHILRLQMQSGVTDQIYELDGVAVYDSGTAGHGEWKEVTFHQPKKPPIPEDAVVLADYMLMADFVAQGANGLDKMSKGVRVVHTTRDTFHDCTNGSVSINSPTSTAKMGMGMNYADFTSEQGPQLTYFGDAKVVGDFRYYSDTVTKIIHHFDGATTNVAVSSQYTDSGAETTSLPSSGGGDYYIYATKSSGTMGVQTVRSLGDELGGTADDWLYHDAYQVATPIHTSSHYQTFETPFLHELVGGDRNMEQTNLVVTADGKTWDEVTRDTSYIGNGVLCTSRDGGTISSATFIPDILRGTHGANNGIQKYFAIAYDRYICLQDGQYEITSNKYVADTANSFYLLKNLVAATTTANIIAYQRTASADDCISLTASVHLKRGDFISEFCNGGAYDGNSPTTNQLYIKKLS